MDDRFQQVECLKAKKAEKVNSIKKEKVAYIEADERDQKYDIGYDDVEDSDINVEELKLGPPYVF